MVPSALAEEVQLFSKAMQLFDEFQEFLSRAHQLVMEGKVLFQKARTILAVSGLFGVVEQAQALSEHQKSFDGPAMSMQGQTDAPKGIFGGGVGDILSNISKFVAAIESLRKLFGR